MCIRLVRLVQRMLQHVAVEKQRPHTAQSTVILACEPLHSPKLGRRTAGITISSTRAERLLLLQSGYGYAPLLLLICIYQLLELPQALEIELRIIIGYCCRGSGGAAGCERAQWGPTCWGPTGLLGPRCWAPRAC